MNLKSILTILLLCLGIQHSKAQLSNRGDCYQNEMVQAVLWQQTSGEYKALCFQAYNSARMMLDIYLNKRRKRLSLPPCIVVDVDETVLNNSPYSGYQVEHCKRYSKEDWNKWSELAIADTVPGSCSFLKYAASKKVAVFYITNRGSHEQETTIKNLKHYGFPNADPAHVMVADSSYKEPRRQAVLSSYNVVLYCGDNLNDFSPIYYKQNVAERNHTVEEQAADFGRRFIMLPNPLYGDWEQALYRDGKTHNNIEKNELKRANIISFTPAK